MGKVKVAVLFGGRSEEHPISIKSAREIARNLDPGKYDPVYIGITMDGSWKLCAGPDSDWEEAPCPLAVLSPDPSVHGLLLLSHGQYKTIRLDVVFPVLHGKYGEDGTMQGLLELSGVAYVGCDIPSSALCIDKSLAYIVARHAGVATPVFCLAHGEGEISSEQFSYPVFVKPARSGSSFGVNKVTHKEALSAAIRDARQYDDKILIEEAIEGREVGCAVLGNDGKITVGEVDQIEMSHGFFRIHQETQPELGSENAKILVPARITDEARVQIQETAKRVYRALGCTGLARVDMFLKEDGTVVLGEVNTMPGFTSYSRYPRMMAEAGLPLSEVIDRVIKLALEKRG